MTYLKEQANNHSARHKVLALVCAVCLAVTQCALLMTITTEDAHASTTISVKARTSYNGGVTSKAKDYSVSGEKKIRILDDEQEPSSTDEDGNPIPGTPKYTEKTVVQVKKVVSKVGLPDSSADGFNGDEWIAKDGNAYHVYEEGEVIDNVQYWKDAGSTGQGSILIDAGDYNPVEKIRISPPGNLSLKKNEQSDPLTVVVDYKNSVFNFSGSDAKFVKIKWKVTNGSGAAKLSAKSGLTTRVTATTVGTYTVTAEDTLTGKTAQVKDDGKQTTTTSQTTTTKATTKSTTKSGGGGGTPTPTPTPTATKDKKDSKSKDISNADVNGLREFAKNPGKSNLDKIKVYYDGEPLKRGVDYYVKVKTGSKKIKIYGTGDYSGTKTVYYSSYTSGNSTYHRWNNNSPNRWTGRRGVTIRTGVTIGNTATTGSVPNMSYAPGQTITVKEIHLGEVVEEQPEETYEEAYDETDGTSEEDYAEETKLDFGPAAGSAAVAIAACGAGAVGRIRRFRVDTTPIDLAAAQTTSGDGPKDAPKDGPKNGAKGGAGEKAPKMSLKEKALKKIGKA